jgi:hypothetical protein
MGSQWETQHSLWIMFTIIPLINAVAYFYAMATSRNSRYARWGVFLLLSIILPAIILAQRNTFMMAGGQYLSAYQMIRVVVIGAFVACLLAGFIHAMRSRTEYLRAVEAIELGRGPAGQAASDGPDTGGHRPPRPPRGYGAAGVPPFWTRTRPGPPEYPRVRDPRLEEDDGCTDVNNCSVDDLSKLPGITTVIAKRLVEIRKTRRGFDDADECCDVLRTLGLNNNELQTLRPTITTRPMAPKDKRQFPGRVVDY